MHALLVVLAGTVLSGGNAGAATEESGPAKSDSVTTAPHESPLSGEALDDHLLPKDRPGDSTNVLSLVFNGYRRAMIEPCGCVNYILGGIDKEARVAVRLKELRVPVMQVDAGGFSQEVATRAARTQTRCQLAALGMMGSQAVNVGFPDLTFPDLLDEARTSLSLPLVSCNIVDTTGTPVFAPTVKTVMRLQGGKQVRVSVLGATRPRIRDAGAASSSIGERGAGKYTIHDPAPSIRHYLPELRKESDFVVLLMYGTREDTLKLLEQLGGTESGIDVAIAGESRGHLATPANVSGTWLVSGGFEGRQVGHMMLEFGERRISGAAISMIDVIQSIPPVPELTKLIKECAEEAAAQRMR